MKKETKQILSLLLALTMLCSGLSVLAADTVGQELSSTNTYLSHSVMLTESLYWSEKYGQLQNENFITYSPTSGITPIVTYGATSNSRISVSNMAKQLEAMGWRVIAGINGDFYGTGNGVPMGLVLSEGIIRSCSPSYYAIGFYADGSAVLGKPQLTATLYYPSGDFGWFQDSVELGAINKVRSSEGGIYAFTYDFNDAHTTGNNQPGVDVICSVTGGSLSIGGSVYLQVDQVLEVSSATPVPEGKILLSANNNNATHANILRALSVGDSLSISVTSPDYRWNNVRYALGAMYPLVESSQISPDLHKDNTPAPRTAVGQRADGSLIFYTVDGRQPGFSKGLTMLELAQRMLELDCVTALCLDGGGSTTLVSSFPYSSKAEVVNSPSDETGERRVSNHIFLVAPAYTTNMPYGVYVSASSHLALPGSQITLRGGLYDFNYQPVESDVSFSASAGSLNGNTLTLPDSPGYVTVTAIAGGLAGTTDIQVVGPSRVEVYADGKVVESLDCIAGTTTQLNATALHEFLQIPTTPKSFSWTVQGDIGTVDENGLFSASMRDAAGSITVRCGDAVKVIPVTITGGVPYVDTEGHWAGSYLGRLYLAGIMTGEEIDGVVYAKPDDNITRQQFAVMIYRYLNLSGDYSHVQLPYADADKIGGWALPAVRAMYELGIMRGEEIDGKIYISATHPLSRAQAVTMAGRLLGKEIPYDIAFLDVETIQSWAMPHVQTLVSMGVIGGYDDGYFRPNGTFTRSQAAKVFYLLLGQK